MLRGLILVIHVTFFFVFSYFLDLQDPISNGFLYFRSKLKQLKKQAWDNNQESDVLCNFYVASTGIVYEGRGWGIKVKHKNSSFFNLKIGRQI